MKSISTRQRIISQIESQHIASAPGLSRALNLTRADIRYHLAALLNDGSIAIAPAPALITARGRPVIYYRLNSTVQSSNFSALASALLAAYLPGDNDSDARQVALEDLAQILMPNPPSERNLTQRLATLMQQFNQWRYQARWEARPSGPMLVLGNCPYAAILPEHPELCQLDRLLIQRASGRTARQTARVDLITQHPPACIFFIDPDSSR